ncbi:MAG: hypothetical protein M3P18_20010 [Actinomycetota bacterium]|nr:hypothetical protein [Actinomycetota bacterium]
MTERDSVAARLDSAIDQLEAETEQAPRDLNSFWIDCVRISAGAWARELLRDLRRSERALGEAATASGSPPSDNQIASLEEALWRLSAAVEKIDALIAILFGPAGIEIYDATARSLRFRPSFDDNSQRLRDIGTTPAARLREARARVEGERALLRRHQLVHSLAPLVELHDLACYVLVHHRDGRIIPGGYELGRLGPERWSDGIRELRPEVMFARRLKEAFDARRTVADLVDALAEAIEAEGMIRVPQLVYRDVETRTLALERPESKGPVPSFAVEFVLGRDADAPRRLVTCSYKMVPGVEINFDDGVWRVIRVQDGEGEPADQFAYCVKSG